MLYGFKNIIMIICNIIASLCIFGFDLPTDTNASYKGAIVLFKMLNEIRDFVFKYVTCNIIFIYFFREPAPSALRPTIIS